MGAPLLHRIHDRGKILWGTGVVAGTLGSGWMFLSITGFFGAVALMFKTFFLGLVAGGVFSLIYRVRARESLSIVAVMVAAAGLLMLLVSITSRIPINEPRAVNAVVEYSKRPPRFSGRGKRDYPNWIVGVYAPGSGLGTHFIVAMFFGVNGEQARLAPR